MATATKALRKENEALKEEIQQIMTKLQHLEQKFESINARVNQISMRCNDIAKCVDAGAERESPETMANLCLQLFAALGVKDISLQDIDIAHRMPARRASSHPNSIICKFVRRLAKNKVMEARKEVSKLQAVQLGFSSGIPVKHVNIYDHLTPRLHTL
ncbi:Hypothetical predicted protein [Paramuricea clavata]|uniref:Uncharacterized protein n=1 Tax=Paramuricea clavata TaxID=317549 RepID=A0A6S7KV74_PARCT|nr:Hypothetical predicted protein [Paramuricea clavata]